MKWAMIRRVGFPPSQIFSGNAFQKPSACFFQAARCRLSGGVILSSWLVSGLGLVAGDVFTLGVVVEAPKNAVRAFSNESCVSAFAGFISAS
jgi:hypothetical protein